MRRRGLAWTAALAAAAAVAAGVVVAMRSRQRRDVLVTRLAGDLADSRGRECALAERLAWYQAAAPVPSLHLVRDQPPARRTSR